MSRARTLRPGFFRNEVLGRMSPWHRLLFEGLWGEADREGRLEDRPMKLKGALFPYDPFTEEQVDAWLGDLDREKFIKRYAHPDYPYPLIQVLNFTKHQHPHKKEPPSYIPAYLPDEKPRKRRGEPRKRIDLTPEKDRPSPAEVPGVTEVSGVTEKGGVAPQPGAPWVAFKDWAYAQWREAGGQGKWASAEWTRLSAGWKSLGDEAARRSWTAFLADGTDFYRGHYPRKWASDASRWLEPARGSPAVPKRTAGNIAAVNEYLEGIDRERKALGTGQAATLGARAGRDG
jgi:hypothetical protein